MKLFHRPAPNKIDGASEIRSIDLALKPNELPKSVRVVFKRERNLEVRLSFDTSYLFNVPLNEASKHLAKLAEDHPDFHLEEITEGYNDFSMIYLVTHRPETDEEFVYRIHQELHALEQKVEQEERAQKEARDLREYQRLKKKYGW